MQPLNDSKDIVVIVVFAVVFLLVFMFYIILVLHACACSLGQLTGASLAVTKSK